MKSWRIPEKISRIFMESFINFIRNTIAQWLSWIEGSRSSTGFSLKNLCPRNIFAWRDRRLDLVRHRGGLRFWMWSMRDLTQLTFIKDIFWQKQFDKKYLLNPYFSLSDITTGKTSRLQLIVIQQSSFYIIIFFNFDSYISFDIFLLINNN